MAAPVPGGRALSRLRPAGLAFAAAHLLDGCALSGLHSQPLLKYKRATQRTDYALGVCTRHWRTALLDLDCRAGFSEFLLNVFRFVFRYAFFDWFRSAFHKILG